MDEIQTLVKMENILAAAVIAASSSALLEWASATDFGRCSSNSRASFWNGWLGSCATNCSIVSFICGDNRSLIRFVFKICCWIVCALLIMKIKKMGYVRLGSLSCGWWESAQCITLVVAAEAVACFVLVAVVAYDVMAVFAVDLREWFSIFCLYF